MKVKERRGTAAKPLRDVLRIGQRRAESHNANGLSDLRRYVPHTRTDHFQHGLYNHQHTATTSAQDNANYAECEL